MARQVLENGVILPAEYSDDWYDDMTSNLTKLDDVIGSDSEKLSSSDVGAAALSNNYNDLDNLPTIPTVNDATLTIQKNGVDVQTFTANASSNVTANITVPTKTSDLTNDSNFVDTSNSAVSSGITSAKVTDYDAHIADTDIHVTTADKNRWDNQTFVFRYSSTALTASSTNSNALLDNTDNLKVGDKVIDSSGVLFSITAIDSQNSTFTIGTALIDLANDSDVVHKSRNEDITGKKTFLGVSVNFKSTVGVYGNTSGNASMVFYDKNSMITSYLRQGLYNSGLPYIKFSLNGIDANNQTVEKALAYTWFGDTSKACFKPETDNFIYLGTENSRWKAIYATNYYYGSNNVEFSTKFVTTDTAQTITETKTFTNTIKIKKEIELTGSRSAYILPDFSASYSGLNLCTYSSSGAVRIGTWKVDDNDNTKHILDSSLGYLNVTAGSINSVNCVYVSPRNTTDSKLGDSTNKWKSFNGLEPSSLSLPSGTSSDQIDISSYFSNTGSGYTNSYTAPANGWIYLYVTACKTLTAYVQNATDTIYSDYRERTTDGQIRIMIPIQKNNRFTSQWTTSTTVSITRVVFIPCQGNV